MTYPIGLRIVCGLLAFLTIGFGLWVFRDKQGAWWMSSATVSIIAGIALGLIAADGS